MSAVSVRRRRRSPTRRRSLASAHPRAVRAAPRVLPPRRSLRSRGSRRSAAGRDPRRARGGPRSGASGSSSCTERRGLAGVSRWRRRGRERRRGAGRSPGARTTVRPSRRAGSLPERGKVAPRIRLVERVRVVHGVASVQLGGPMASEQRAERLVDQHGIRDTGAHSPGALEEVGVDGGADACAGHATNMPCLRERGGAADGRRPSHRAARRGACGAATWPTPAGADRPPRACAGRTPGAASPTGPSAPRP